MSSFRWGMIACPTPTNSQVTVWKLRQPLFSHQNRTVLLTALHSDVLLGSAGIPLHFGLSLCNPLEQIRLPYGKWKRTSRAICWYRNLDIWPTDRYFMTIFWGLAGVCQTPSSFWSVTLQPVGADEATIWQMKGDILSFHMRYGRLNSIHRLQRKINFFPLSFFCLVCKDGS